MKPTIPIISGGMNALRLPGFFENLGHGNVINTAGGGAYGHIDSPAAGARSLRPRPTIVGRPGLTPLNGPRNTRSLPVPLNPSRETPTNCSPAGVISWAPKRRMGVALAGATPQLRHVRRRAACPLGHRFWPHAMRALPAAGSPRTTAVARRMGHGMGRFQRPWLA